MKFTYRRNNVLNIDFLLYFSGPVATREPNNNAIGRVFISDKVKENFQAEKSSIKKQSKIYLDTTIPIFNKPILIERHQSNI